MAILVKPLSPSKINNAKPQKKSYKLFDGNGLHLEVTPAGNKIWKVRYRLQGRKETQITVGTYPGMSLDVKSQ